MSTTIPGIWPSMRRPDCFKARFGIRIGGQDDATIGKRLLLEHPDKRQAKCSRKFTDDERRTVTEKYTNQARNGTIRVSPATSKGEQNAMRTAHYENLPIIFLTPWGFTAFSKPGRCVCNAM